MPNWERDKFTWERLEEVYNEYPSAIAACIKGLCNPKKKIDERQKLLEEGVIILLFSLQV